MRKFPLICICMTFPFMLTACSMEMPWSKEEVVEEETEESLPPTLEETLGFTGYDLLSGDAQFKFQEVNLQADVSLAVTVKGRSVMHSIQHKVTHKTDEDASYSVIAITDKTDSSSMSNTVMAYVDMVDRLIYRNVGYAGWQQEEYSVDDMYYSQVIPTSTINVSSFEQQGDRLYVEGFSSALSDCDFDKYIKTVLEDYSLSDASYTFRAVYDFSTKNLIMLSADVTVTGDGQYDDSQCTVSSMTVTYTSVTGNDTDVVTIPQYVIDTAGFIAEVTDNQETEINSSAMLCETLFGLQADSDTVSDYLTQNGFTGEALSAQTGLDGEAVLTEIVSMLVSMSYDDFVAQDTANLSGERLVAFNMISIMLPAQPTAE